MVIERTSVYKGFISPVFEFLEWDDEESSESDDDYYEYDSDEE